MRKVVLTGSFDDLRSHHVRLLEEASKLGEVHVLLWPDDSLPALEGRRPKFPQEERLYLVQSLRYVRAASLAQGPFDRDAIPQVEQVKPDVWVVEAAADSPEKQAFCRQHGIAYRFVSPHELQGFPEEPVDVSEGPGGRKKAVVTGCFDWLHSGHVRFFEEVSQLGAVYVVVGHDENVRLLKGAGHPLFSQQERRYMVQAVRHVYAALISSGMGWLDAEAEIERIRPDLYVVNEDGDKPEKRAYCARRGLEYVVLKRKPKAGLPRRESTHLRGF